MQPNQEQPDKDSIPCRQGRGTAPAGPPNGVVEIVRHQDQVVHGLTPDLDNRCVPGGDVIQQPGTRTPSLSFHPANVLTPHGVQIVLATLLVCRRRQGPAPGVLPRCLPWNTSPVLGVLCRHEGLLLDELNILIALFVPPTTRNHAVLPFQQQVLAGFHRWRSSNSARLPTASTNV
jgi:hypothetical protein